MACQPVHEESVAAAKRHRDRLLFGEQFFRNCNSAHRERAMVDQASTLAPWNHLKTTIFDCGVPQGKPDGQHHRFVRLGQYDSIILMPRRDAVYDLSVRV